MEKMISPNGVKANICCASCLYYEYKFTRGEFMPGDIIKWCSKKNRRIAEIGYKCGYYTMAKFFQEGGYKVIKD